MPETAFPRRTLLGIPMNRGNPSTDFVEKWCICIMHMPLLAIMLLVFER
jgi:hypothetical protein